MYKVIATAPTTYQLNSVRQFGSPITSHRDGSHVFSQSFETEEEAKEYLKRRAHLYYNDTEEELNEAMESIEKYGSLSIDAVTASIEEKEECPACYGKKVGYFSCCTGNMVDEDIAMCPSCYEHLGEDECGLCDGTGVIN
jgi:hypothetical protein